MYIEESIMEIANQMLCEMSSDYMEMAKRTMPSFKDMDKQMNTFISIINKCYSKLKDIAKTEPSIQLYDNDAEFKKSLNEFKNMYKTNRSKFDVGYDTMVAMQLGAIDKNKLGLFQFGRLEKKLQSELTDCIPSKLQYENKEGKDPDNHVVKYKIMIKEDYIGVRTELIVNY